MGKKAKAEFKYWIRTVEWYENEVDRLRTRVRLLENQLEKAKEIGNG